MCYFVFYILVTFNFVIILFISQVGDMRPTSGLSKSTATQADPQKETNPSVASRIDQPNKGYSNGQYTGYRISQTNGNTYINPSMANTYLPNRQQDTQYDYKPQGKVDEVKTQVRVDEIKTQTNKVGEVKTQVRVETQVRVDEIKKQAKVGEFEWLTHTYAINYFAYNGNASKIAEIVWANLTAVKKIVIYTNQTNMVKINDQIERKLNKNTLSKITIINQSHPSYQLKQKYAQFVLSQNKILITTKGSAGSFETGLIDIDDVQMIIFDGVCEADDQYRQRVLRSYQLQPNKRGVAITVCCRDQSKLLSTIQSRLKIKFIQFKSNDLPAYLKQKTTNSFYQSPNKSQMSIIDSRKKNIYDSQSELIRPSPTKRSIEQVADLSWITHFYFKPEYYSWKKVVSILNQNKDNYKKAVVYVSSDNFKKLKIYINDHLDNKSEVQYVDDSAWQTFGEAVNNFAASPSRILVVTKNYSRMVPVTPIDADNINLIITDGILQAKDYKGIFTRTNLSKQEKAVSIVVLEYGKGRKEDLISLERQTDIKILQWNNQKLSDYLTIKQHQISSQPEQQTNIANRMKLSRKEQQQIRRKEEQQKRKEEEKRQKEQQQLRRKNEEELKIKKEQQLRKEEQQFTRKKEKEQQQLITRNEEEQLLRRRKEQEELRRRKEQQLRRRKEEQQLRRRKEQEELRRRKEQQLRRRKEEQQLRRRKEEQQLRRRKEQEELRRRNEQELRRRKEQQQLRRRKEQEELRRRNEQELRRRKEEQQLRRRKEQEEMRRRNELELRRRKEEEELRRRKEQEELRRRKEEQQLRRKKEQQLRKKKEQQQQLRRRKEQEELRRRKEQQQFRRRKEQEELRRRKEEQQLRRRKEEEELRRKKEQEELRIRRKEQEEQKRKKVQQQRRRKERGNERSAGIGFEDLEYETAANNGRDAKIVDKFKDSRKILTSQGDRQKSSRIDSRLSEQNNQQKSTIKKKSEIYQISQIQKSMQPPVNIYSILTEFDAETSQISPTRKKDAPLSAYEAQKIQSKTINQLTNGLNRIESIAKDGSNTQAIILQKTMTLQSGQQQLIRDVNFLKQENRRNNARNDVKKDEGAVYDKIYRNTEKIIEDMGRNNNKPSLSDPAVLNELSDSKKLLKQFNQRTEKKLDTIIVNNENISKDQNELKTGIQRNFKQINENMKLMQWLVQQQKTNKKRITTDDIGVKIQELNQMIQTQRKQMVNQSLKQFLQNSRQAQHKKNIALMSEREKLSKQAQAKEQEIIRYRAQLQQQQKQLQKGQQKHQKQLQHYKQQHQKQLQQLKQQQQKQVQEMAQKLVQKQCQIARLREQQQGIRIEMRQQKEQNAKLLKTMFEKLSQQIASIKSEQKKQQISNQNRQQEQDKQDKQEKQDKQKKQEEEQTPDGQYIFNNDQRLLRQAEKLKNNL